VLATLVGKRVQVPILITMKGCLPLEKKKRSQFAALKRAEYRHLVSKHYSRLLEQKDVDLLQQVLTITT
jgi:hypothetical protein